MPHPTACTALDSSVGAPFPTLSTLLAIPGRLSRVRHGGLRQHAVGGVFLPAPSALGGFLVVTRGRAGLPALSVARHAKCLPRSILPPIDYGFWGHELTSHARF